MARVVVDSNVLIAARLTRDQHHGSGAELAHGFDQGDLPTAYVLSDVLEEICNYLHTRSTHGRAIDTLDAIVESRGFEIVFVPKRDFDAARSLFRKYDQLALTDAIIVAFMQRQNVQYLYSFDEDFDTVDGIRRLHTATDPFDAE